ncbi:MAG: DUF1990 domain-containing protein [Bdellovibrio sp.]|nr:DUF1990 domain-containing protein [Bdellovibrio sp.]
MANSLNWDFYRPQIQNLAKLNFNYDEKVYQTSEDKKGWKIDRYQALLAIEPPGPPLINGAFKAVQNSLRLYQFPDPRLISAIFDPDRELYGRDMLMLAKFAGFTFTFGVRITAVIDEVRTDSSKQKIQVWGYSYRTLTGHFEIGEIRFEVFKNLKSGEVFFEINAYSKPDRIPNFFNRTGFRLFGRSLQKYFATSSIDRLQKLAQKSLSQKI